MVESTVSLLESLEKAVALGGGSADVEMQRHMQDVTVDIISRSIFGSSYKKGKKVFEEQQKLVELLVVNNPFFSLPGLRLLLHTTLVLFSFSQIESLLYNFNVIWCDVQ